MEKIAASIFAGGIVALLMSGSAAAQPINCPAKPTTTISAQVPADVCIPSGFQNLPLTYFDDYSWRAFIALVWPADLNNRGQPDPAASFGDTSRPLVFETYKAEWELFSDPPAVPVPWRQMAPRNPCGRPQVGPADMILGSFSFSKLGNLGEAGGSAAHPLVGTLVSQNGQYVRYSTGFNQIEYEKILQGELYLLANQQNVAFPSGAIDVKASWMDMANVTNPGRYYTRKAWVLDPGNNNACTEKLVGLIGLHIVQKTPSRPQWIWTTFEHVDNVPPDGGPAMGRVMALNKGDGVAMPAGFPVANQWPPKFPPPPPYNVTRVKPIFSDTSDPAVVPTTATNARYQAAIANTVWKNYQLVMTQWPVPPGGVGPVPPTETGAPINTFPGSDNQGNETPTASANTTMETFDQKTVRVGCMACHNLTRTPTDFVWSLAANALKTPPPAPAGMLALEGRRPLAAQAPSPNASEAEKTRRVGQLLDLLRSTNTPEGGK